MRDGMALYLAGLLLITGAIELTIALFLAVQGRLPAPSSQFLGVYAVVDIVMFVSGGWLALWGFIRLRAGAPKDLPPVGAVDPPAG